jgi:urocanate reductase
VSIEKSADVVVVGSGLAGLSAAVCSAESGMSVIVLERMSKLGGTTRISEGIFNSYDPRRQTIAHIEDSPEKHLSDILRVGRNRNHRNLAKTLCYEAYPALSWLENMGFAFADDIEQVKGSPYPRSHRPKTTGKGAAYIDFLTSKLQAIGRAEILTGVLVKNVLRDRSKGRVTGVSAEAGKESLNISARRGVVLAFGGFQASNELMARYSPLLSGVECEGAEGCRGELLSSVQDIGAQVVNTGYYVWETVLRKGNRVLLNPSQFILVNKLGRRFCREDLQFDALGERILQQKDHQAWCVSPFLSSTDSVPFSDEILFKTVSAYNENASLKEDRAFGKSSAFLTPLTGKLGLVAAKVFVKTTLGGLLVNEKAQVLDRQGMPINGLTAAGDALGGLFGCWASAGDNLAAAAVFGRVAGMTISQSL